MRLCLPACLLTFVSTLGAFRNVTADEGAQVSFETSEARQAVAVDDEYFYAIGNRAIGKYERSSGKKVSGWEGDASGPISHLNSGVVRDGRLYCAHSNYPDLPMTSSVEIWDTATLEHVGCHSFGIAIGSLTWIDWHQDEWWAGFAVYSGTGRAPPGQDSAWTQVIQFDLQWRRQQAWVFPKSVVDKLRPMSNSGASWGKDGRLYCTGHDNHEVYAMQIPSSGSTLQYVETVPVASYGQGIAWNRSTNGSQNELWGIIKASRRVVVSVLPNVVAKAKGTTDAKPSD